EHLFVGTGNGIWRAELDAADYLPNGSFEFLGPEVVQGTTTYVPEIRALTLVDAESNGSVTTGDLTGTDLVAGAWGKFLIDGDLVSAFLIEDPSGAAGGADATEELALRGTEVSFIEAASDGRLFLGTTAGLVTLDGGAASTSTASEPETAELPDNYTLEQNYPNPFNPVTTIGFALPETGNVRLAVYDVLGRQVALLASGTLEAGSHEVHFEATNLPSGTYLYRLDTAQGSFTRQLVLMK
ncbi:MAG: T9SS type A sorting domain-containing protein, partial [Rhodothermales bacterium]|nr:T9SS type A sorting domain-containing protein [Rhodothermales bacterium]